MKIILNSVFVFGFLIGALFLPIDYLYYDGSNAPHFFWLFAIPALGSIAGIALMSLCYLCCTLLSDLSE